MSWQTRLKKEYPHLYNPEVISLIESIRQEAIREVISEIPNWNDWDVSSGKIIDVKQQLREKYLL